jgi:hypothetical protein
MEDQLVAARSIANDESALREKLSGILTRTAIALKGPSRPLALHDWSDLPDVAAALADKVAGSEAGAAVMRTTLEQVAARASHPVGRLLEQVESTTRTRARLALEGSTGAALVEGIRAALDQLQQSADACGFCDGDAVVHHEKCSIPDCDHEEPCPDCREVRAVLELPAFALFRSRAE